MDSNSTLRSISNTFSGIFSPLLVPTYAMAIALWISPLSQVPESARLTVSAIIFVITAIVPMSAIIVMIRLGLVSDLAISDRRQRTVPFVITAVCYILAAFYLKIAHAPSWLSLFFVAAAISALIAMIVSLWWKISAHGIGMGGLCGMLIWMGLNHNLHVNSLWWVIGAVILSGCVASSRVFLNRHTPLQTYAGWLLGVILPVLIMSL